MMNSIKFGEIKVCDNLIIDGHHRYIASLLAEVEVGIISTAKTSATKEYSWLDVKFVNEEWDTEDKIRRLNEMDAEFNNVPLDEVRKLTE